MRKKKRLKRKHTKLIEELKAKLKKGKKNRIKIIKNEAFKLISNLAMKNVALKNEIKILVLELEELWQPKKS